MNKLFLSLLFIAFATVSQAQKFGYINSQAILELMPEFKTANSDLDVLKAQLEKKGKDMVQTLQMKYQDLQKKQESGTVAPVELQKQAEELKAEEGKLGEFEQTSQEMIYKKTEELLKPLQEKFNLAVKAVASEGGYSYIFDSGAGMILYADTTSDCTEQLKAKLGIPKQ
jgi:outer membrane protein